MKSTAAARIEFNLAEVARLAQHQPIIYQLAGLSIEVSLQPNITPRLLIGAMLDLLNGETVTPGDPPQAREFLPNRRHGKPGK
jgi:hypothetical protein